MNKKALAGTALAISLCGAAGTAPISGSFAGGLIHNGFLAASIGGLADWFAVTALFRKPLGISYRTEILTRNRQRIMQAVVDFAGNDLLNTENIMGFINQHRLSDMLVAYLSGSERQRLISALEGVLSETLNQLDSRELANLFTSVVMKELQEERIEEMARSFSREACNNETAKALLPILITVTKKLMDDEGLKSILKNHLSEVLTKYEGAGAGRAFVLGLIGLDADKLYETIRDKVEVYLARLEDEEDELYAQAIDVVADQLQHILDSQRVISSISGFIRNSASPEKINCLIADWLERQLTEERDDWQQRIIHLAEEKIDDFIQNDEWQQSADNAIKSWLEKELSANHRVITGMIEERLNRLTDAELVEFVEPKVSDDLQMIRINGSIVGGLAGMVLYIVTYIAGQVLTR